jgi:Tfp pilus assembly major pilin PilA
MKDSLTLVITIALLAVVAGKLYKKYFGKDKVQTGTSRMKGSSFPTSSGEDDYEPYSKK